MNRVPNPKYGVHNHGPEEGPGLSCNELLLSDNTIAGRCLVMSIDELRQSWIQKIVSDDLALLERLAVED